MLWIHLAAFALFSSVLGSWEGQWSWWGVWNTSPGGSIWGSWGVQLGERLRRDLITLCIHLKRCGTHCRGVIAKVVFGHHLGSVISEVFFNLIESVILACRHACPYKSFCIICPCIHLKFLILEATSVLAWNLQKRCASKLTFRWSARICIVRTTITLLCSMECWTIAWWEPSFCFPSSFWGVAQVVKKKVGVTET